MYQFKSEFLKHINDRGYIYQVSDPKNLDKVFLKEKVTAYIGFDCTAPNLHIGSLMQIMLLKKMQDFGHAPIVLIGGATSKIGDPSLKDKSRKMLTFQEIEHERTNKQVAIPTVHNQERKNCPTGAFACFSGV